MLPRQTICNAAAFHFIVIHFFITQWAVIVDNAPMVMIRRRHALLIRKAYELIGLSTNRYRTFEHVVKVISLLHSYRGQDTLTS